jgi:hypothetical protein
MDEILRRTGVFSYNAVATHGARKLAIAVALGLAALASGCGGSGDGDAGADANDFAQAVDDEEPSAPSPEQAALADAALLATADRAPLGVNLEGVADWSRLQPFVDLMKSARPWGTVDAPWDEAAAVDARGWPTGDAAVMVNVRTAEPGDEGKPYTTITPGVYRLQFAGRAAVDASASTDVAVRNVQYDAASNRSVGEVVVGKASTQLVLAFRGTAGGVRNVSLRTPGYRATQTFTHQFAAALAPFRVVRFMDFLRTNNNPVRTWQQRTVKTSGSQASAKGAAYEYAIEVANQLGKDIWINVPVHANDTYVRSLAALLKSQLLPGRVVYVEYSNELWNHMFTQTADNMNLAVSEAVAGDRTLTKGRTCTRELFAANSGDCNPYWAGYFRVGKRTVRIAQIFSEVYGPGALNNQVRVVYATQFANPGIAEQVLKNISTYRGVPSSLIYGVATAPYFYLDENLAASTTATPAQIIESLGASLATENEAFFGAVVRENGAYVRKPYTGGDFTGASHKALADYYGIKSLAYEGGPDLRQNPANQVAKLTASRDVQMAELVRREATKWFGCGNDLFMHFSLSSSWDRYGHWGLTNDPTNLDVPKYKAARAVAESPKSAWTSCP